MKKCIYENMMILKYEGIRFFRQTLQIKWENVFLPLAIYCCIHQFINAQVGMKLLAVVMMTMLFFAVWYGSREMRREGLQEIKSIEKEMKKELDCIKKRSYSSKRTIFIDQNYNHSFLLSR